MDDALIRLECLKLAVSGSPEATVKGAQSYYEFVKPKNTAVLPEPAKVPFNPMDDDRPWVDEVTGRRYKKEADLKKAITMRQRTT